MSTTVEEPPRALVIVGAASGGKEAAWAVEEANRAGTARPSWEILGYADDNPALVGRSLYGYPVLGAPEEVGARLGGRRTWFCIVVGDNRNRERLAERALALGWSPATIVHPAAAVARGVVLGEGTYVGPLALLSVDAVLGRFVLVNYRAAVTHDVEVGDFANVGPGAQVNGRCRVGRGATIGANATLLPDVKLGARSVVGAGAVVLHDVPEGVTVVGVPARTVLRLTASA